MHQVNKSLRQRADVLVCTAAVNKRQRESTNLGGFVAESHAERGSQGNARPMGPSGEGPAGGSAFVSSGFGCGGRVSALWMSCH